LTAPNTVSLIGEALRGDDEKSLDILLYRKNGKYLFKTRLFNAKLYKWWA